MSDFGYKRNLDVNECTSRGSCSNSPAVAALEELSVAFMQQLAYYLLRLEKFGASNGKIWQEIVNIMASLVLVNEFSDQQLYYIVQKEFYMLEEVKKTYTMLTNSKPLKSKMLKTLSKFGEKTTLAQAIALGEKISLENLKKNSSHYKISKEILLMILKSVCLNLVKLQDFSYSISEVVHEILDAVDILNSQKFSEEILDDVLYKLVDIDRNLQLSLYNMLIEEFKGISTVNVSRSSRKGKAILVSGENLFDLYKILIDTQDADIDIYTHSNLLIAHALKTFQKFKHLKAHYGDGTESCILDFATFPGAILLTKSSHGNNEYYYRGRLFSNNYILPKGVIKILDDDFTPVIEAALSAKGFSKGKIKDDIVVGYDFEKVVKTFKNLADKIETHEVKKIYIIWTDPHSETQKAYFSTFLSKLKTDEFAISFSYDSEKENVYSINVGNCYPLAVGLLNLLFEYVPLNSENLYFFFTLCDVMSISNIIALKHNGAKNISMYRCSPLNINPLLLNMLNSKFGINFYSN